MRISYRLTIKESRKYKRLGLPRVFNKEQYYYMERIGFDPIIPHGTQFTAELINQF